MRQSVLKNILLVLASLAIPFLNPNIATAQLIHGIKHAVISTDSIVNLDSCWVPVIPTIIAPEQVIVVKSGMLITFCIDKDGATAVTYKYSIQIDQQTPQPLMVNCFKMGIPTTCLATIPDSSVALLANDLAHGLYINVRDQMDALIGNVNLPVRRPTCLADNVKYSNGVPLPAVVIGALRNQQGSFTFETQVGKLRDAGWHIEWQRVQFGLDLDGKNGYWYMLGWCEGI